MKNSTLILMAICLTLVGAVLGFLTLQIPGSLFWGGVGLLLGATYDPDYEYPFLSFL